MIFNDLIPLPWNFYFSILNLTFTAKQKTFPILFIKNKKIKKTCRINLHFLKILTVSFIEKCFG